MGLVAALGRLLGGEGRAADDPPAAPSEAAPGPSTPLPRLGSTPPNGWGGWGYAGSGAYLSENLPTAVACVNAISSAIAALPCFVYRREGSRRVEVPDHPVARLIRQPNELQSWPDFIEWMLGSTLLFGNGLAVVDWDGAGRPVALYPVPWWCCQPLLVPATTGEAMGSPTMPNSRLAFDVTQTMSPYPMLSRPAGFPKRFFADEVLLLRDRSDTAVLGRSRLSRSPEAVAAALGAQGYSAATFANGAMLTGVITHPGKLSKEASERIAQSWNDTHSGASNAGRTAVLEEGSDFKPIATSPEDAELLDSRRFSVEEIARLYGVPPPIVGDWSRSTFSSTAAANSWFATLTLMPWVRKIEREFSRTVITDPSVEIEFDLSGLLRGDYATRMETDVAAVRAGIFTPNEVRVENGLNPLPGGDELRPQAVGGAPGQEADPATDPMPRPKPNGAAVH